MMKYYKRFNNYFYFHPFVYFLIEVFRKQRRSLSKSLLQDRDDVIMRLIS